MRTESQTDVRGGLPLVLWGCGDVADSVCDYLTLHGLKPDAVWVDGSFDSGDFYRGIPVYDFDGIEGRFPKYNVILGHSHYELGEGLRSRSTHVNEVFYAFSASYAQYDKVPLKAVEAVKDRYSRFYQALADDDSRRNLIAYLNTKVTGDVSHILDVYRDEMNFFRNDVFVAGGDEVLLDIGAYDGDTMRLFLRETDGHYRRILAIEPDDENYIKLNDYIVSKHLLNVFTSKYGAWDECTELRFATGDEQISSVVTKDGEDYVANREEQVITIYADRLDRIFEGEAVSLIKINYFSGVVEAIKGCGDIIAKNLPKLAVDVGFEIYNMLDVYEYLDSLNLGYKFYLRFNRAMSSTLTLYAVAYGHDFGH